MIRKLLVWTTTPLQANQEFVSEWIKVEWANSIYANSLADTSGELFLEFSNNGQTVHFSQRMATSANIPALNTVLAILPFVRVRYKNGATAQTSFQCALIGYFHRTR